MVHCLLHLLMGHPFCHQEKDIRLWNLASDMAVEVFLYGTFRIFFIRALREGEGQSAGTFFRLCRWEHSRSFLQLLFGKRSFGRRAGGIRVAVLYWIAINIGNVPEKSAVQGGRKTSGELTGNSDEEETPENPAAGAEAPEETARKEKQEKKWKQLARQVQTDLELFQRRQGIRAGSLIQGMKPFLFETVDYTAFLRMFAAENEVLQISDEEFDPIYYTYGLQKYGNIPLIEPLEYSNLHRIREFVIAIDTSGSVQGEIVAEFLRQTVRVLHQTASFTDQVAIFILQCDAQIQSCIQIHELKELDEYIDHLELYGFGGTDFRPVFEYVEQLLEQKKLKKVNGLLYFTDGAGIYPEIEPAYKTAFIFNRDDYSSPKVPEWAIRAVLTSDNIRILKKNIK